VIYTRALVVSRSKDIAVIAKWYCKRWKSLNVQGTTEDGERLIKIIGDMRPNVVLFESCFYQAATPFMLGRLLKKLPRLHVAVFSIGEFPDDLAMQLIFHGVESYIDLRSGFGEFRRGLKSILYGHSYIDKRIQEKINMLDVIPQSRLYVPSREMEVLHLLANGKMTQEIADILHISFRTVETTKTALYGKLHVRNIPELIRIALYLDMIKQDDLCFLGRGSKDATSGITA
jgi:DNA-binding NarL/FixJ family response regulator